MHQRGHVRIFLFVVLRFYFILLLPTYCFTNLWFSNSTRSWRPSPETWGVRARIRVGKGALRKSLWGLSRVPSRTSKVLNRKLGGHARATKLARVLQVEGIWVVADRVRVELRGLLPHKKAPSRLRFLGMSTRLRIS